MIVSQYNILTSDKNKCVFECACTFNGEWFPHSEQLALCVDRDLKVQQSFVHDERI